MNTYLKISSVKTDKNCNCISPFYIDNITGINPNTGRVYTDEDKNTIKTELYRISNAKGCNLEVCCDPNDPTSNPDPEYTKNFKNRYPKIMPIYEGRNLISIKLSTTADVKESGWQEPTPNMICKITKSKIQDTENPQIKIATNLVRDCFTDQCNQAESIALNNLMKNKKPETNYTYVDDARVSQAILDGNINYVKEYIRKYKQVNLPLTNNDYNNRMLHIAAESNNKKSKEILNMLLTLKANINVRNKLQETPLHFAVRSKNIDVIDILLTQGADVTITNNNGETAMFYAMKTGDIRIVRMLYNNNASVLSVDKYGNNLIHYCIVNCQVYNEETKEEIPNGKTDIIRFLVNLGVSTEQKNLAGITPLELTAKEINKQINIEKGIKISNDNNEINEAFFNIKPIREAFSNGATSIDISGNTLEHNELLEIQTMLFNNIIRNNPDKYNKYISVADIPAGAPIEVLDTVCIGDNIDGNENSEECIAKGGRISKITNKTTKIKLELLPEEETKIDALKRKELYFPKEQNRIPKGTIPATISSYNESVINPAPTQTAGITYTIGATSNNEINTTSTPTQSATPMQTTTPTQTEQSKNIETFVNSHPNIDNFEDVVKYENQAKENSKKLNNSSITEGFSSGVFNDNKTSLMSLLSIIIFIIVVLMVYYCYNKFYKK
jgi:ankyrin repeat protein